MSTFIRKVKTKSGATAVQVVRKSGRSVVEMKHIGSAHSQADLQILLESAHQYIHAGQSSLFPPSQSQASVVALGSSSAFLFDTLRGVYQAINFDQLEDNVFTQLVLARLIEPSSKLDTVRILGELGLTPPSYSGIHRCLKRIVQDNYRSKVAKLCVQSSQPEHFSLLLYDVTTLYFEIQREDEFRKSGLSKERRLDPQIVVGLLVDRSGFPLELHEFQGNLAETKTLIPVVTQFCQNHQLDTSKITITADAGMLSANNLVELENAGFSFVVGSRIAKTPYQIRELVKSNASEKMADKQIFESTQTFGYRREDKQARRVIYQYREKRAQLDLSNIEKQVAKAKAVVSGASPMKKAPFLTITKRQTSLNQDLIKEHKLRAGIKGYVTNIPSPQDNPTSGVPPQELIAAYHQLFQVEKSFRMSKSDLKARPIFHHTLDSIKAHLTIVFAALAIARLIEARTGISIKKFIQKLKVIHTPTLLVNGVETKIQPLIPEEVSLIVEKLSKN